MDNQDVTEVQPKVGAEATPQAQETAAPVAGRLVGQVANNCYNIGVISATDVKEDGSFTIPNAVAFGNIDEAIANLEEVIKHAREVQLQVAYHRGTQAAQAAAPEPAAEQTA